EETLAKILADLKTNNEKIKQGKQALQQQLIELDELNKQIEETKKQQVMMSTSEKTCIQKLEAKLLGEGSKNSL
ncbi:hypothetical protein CHS0354_025794, partial [Potamilus streckersoni]